MPLAPWEPLALGCAGAKTHTEDPKMRKAFPGLPFCDVSSISGSVDRVRDAPYTAEMAEASRIRT